MLFLKEENSKLRDIVSKNGDAEKLREENYKMRHELMIIRNANESFSPRKITYTEQQVKHSDVSVSENQTLMTAKVQ